MFGLLGLPHILMRFYTVPDAKAARKSVLYATGFIGYFYIIIPIVGFGAAVLVGRDVDHRRSTRAATWPRRCSAELLGGTPFLGFIAAVAFATILAVVAGLTLAGASAFSHDIYVARHQARPGHRGGAGEGGPASPPSSSASAPSLLGILFKGQNVAFMVGLAFAIAAQRQLPGAAPVDRLEAVHHPGAVCVDPGRRVPLASP